MSQDIIVRYKAEVDDLTRQLNEIINLQEAVVKGQKEGQIQVDSNISTQEAAAKKRLQLLALERKELEKLKQLKALAFDPKVISEYNRKINDANNNIRVLGGKVKESFGGVAASIKTIGKQIAATLGVAFTVDAVINFSKAAVNAFIEAEKNANQLRNAIVSIAGQSERAFDRLIKQSKELQEITIFSDDDIQRAQTALATFGLTAKQIEELIPKLADFATVSNTDIVSAAQQVGAGLEGAGREFKKYGIEVSATSTRQENLNKILSGFSKFAGSAERATESFSGKIAQQRNRINELQEQIGQKLLPSFLKIQQFGLRAIKVIADLFGDETQSQAEQASEKFTKIAAEFNTSIEVLKRGNVTQEQRKTLIAEINEQYGEYLPNLLTEKSSLQEIEIAQKAVNKQLEGRILLVALEEDIVRITKNAAIAARDLLEVQKDRIKAEKDFSDNAKLAVTVRERLNLREALANELLKVGRDELAALQKQYADLAKQLGINFNETSKLNLESANGNEKARVALDETIQQLETIKKTYVELTPLQNIWVKQFESIDAFRDAVKDAVKELEKLIVIPDKLSVDATHEIKVKVTVEETETLLPELNAFFENNEQIIDASQSLVNELNTLFSTYTNAQVARINREKDEQLKALDIEQGAITAQLDRRAISELDAEKLSAELIKKKLDTEKRALEEERKLKRKAAILEKSAALIQITIDTARAVASVLDTGPAAIALAALYAALGAAQAATVAATPIPYKKGSKDTGAKGHMAIVGEEDPEFVWMQPHSKVLPARQTKTYGEALDAMYDGRFEKYILKNYITPVSSRKYSAPSVSAMKRISAPASILCGSAGTVTASSVALSSSTICPS